ncbi:nucleoporin complex subunit 54-domain-containing protein [Rhypophila decipiens]|uniref:Nucleoporin complex subunit 54-domain-containing protein n=1 Tax=Rhypophila decipiens TaxID=261697 RepID=A0AAN6YDU4_9PEZI|nr:nucleoporin complex subunit 54-domain-containing protein [Rhypophila decipiens]
MGQQQAKPAGGLFGQSTTTTTGGLFGQSQQQPQQQQQAQASGLFGQPQQSQQQQQQQAGGLFGQPQQSQQQQQQQPGGLFGQSQQPQQQQQQTGGLFGQPQQQQLTLQQQQAQQAQLQHQQSVLNASLWQPSSQPTYRKSVPDQMAAIKQKWDPSNPNCVFKTYLYNKVAEHTVPHYTPGPNDDPKEWEEALQKKPAPNYIPVLCAGFPSIIARLILQRTTIKQFNVVLHNINAELDRILSTHDLEHSVRALNARRRHAELSKRCLALASRVQVLRNRGYALSGDEDALKEKLQKIDKGLQDPALSARMEELWSRLIILRGYAEKLKGEINKPGFAESEGLGEEVEAKAKKILEDYDKQLQHLKRQVEETKKDFDEWEKIHNPKPAPAEGGMSRQPKV